MNSGQRFGILAIGFTIGIALMGMQMLLSRPLATHFGSDIIVWSTLISVTMLSMMVGYFLGGRIADAAPRSDVLGAAVVLAAVYFALVPPLLQAELLAGAPLQGGGLIFEGAPRSILMFLSDVEEISPAALGALLAAMALVFVPFALMSLFSPFCIRLLLADAQSGGRTSGSVYAITTLGNIIGTLGTTFVMMPRLPVAQGVMIYAVVLALCGIGLVMLRIRVERTGA
jgi:hypothetical protein